MIEQAKIDSPQPEIYPSLRFDGSNEIRNITVLL